MRYPVDEPYREGYQFNDPTFYGAKHAGIDYLLPKGREVKAAHSGKVVRSYLSKTLGNAVVIQDGDLKTVYGHMSERKVKAGQQVNEGDVIGLVGSTGLSTANHVHFEVKIKDKAVNPKPYLEQGENVTQDEKDFEKIYFLLQVLYKKAPNHDEVRGHLAHVKGIEQDLRNNGYSAVDADSLKWDQFVKERIKDNRQRWLDLEREAPR